jgi:hypothetical protein
MNFFDGALVEHQGTQFGVIVVSPGVPQNPAQSAAWFNLALQIWGPIPLALMTQDARGVPTYYSDDSNLVQFLSTLPLESIPWQRWTVS